MAEKGHTTVWPGIAGLVIATGYLIAMLGAEKQNLIIILLAAGIVAVLAAAWLGLLETVSASFVEHEDALAVCAIGAACAVGAVFHDNHFVLLLVITVLLYSVATLGLNVQFGYAGVLNFAGASFFGIGAYTSAVLNAYTAAMIFFCLGGLLWYSLLYRTAVVPRWLAGWGFLSTLPLLVSITLTLWDRSLGLGVIAGIPYIPFEFTIGIWLLIFAGRSVAAHHGASHGTASRTSAPARLGGALS